MYRRIVFLTLVLVVFLAACGRSALDENELPSATAPSAGPTATLPPPVVVEGGQEQPQEPVAAEPTAPVGPSSPWPWPANAFGYGVQSHAVVGDPRVTMEVVSQQLGMEWVKVQLEWPLVEPEPGLYQWFFYDGVVDEAYNHGLRLMFSVVGAPAWTRSAGDVHGPPDDYNLYANFLTALLNQYPGKIHAIEVWNEQNIDREWKSAAGIAPANYIDFLSRAHAAIKAYDPNIIVISGALAPTGVSDGVTVLDDFVYLDEALAGGMLKYADCVGAHHNGYNIGPDVPFDQTGSHPEAATAIFRGPFDNPHHSWSFKTTLDTYAEKISAVDPTKKLCVTEFGWASSEGYDTYPQEFEFAQDNTLEEQATYIVQAFQQMKASGDVWLAFLFNFDFGNKGGGPTDRTVPYSIVDLVGAPRPAFSAVAEMAKER
jgi:polysaccharide biosynthesis protein PslG